MIVGRKIEDSVLADKTLYVLLQIVPYLFSDPHEICRFCRIELRVNVLEGGHEQIGFVPGVARV